LSDDADIWIAGESLERGVGVYYYNGSFVRGAPPGERSQGEVWLILRRGNNRMTNFDDVGRSKWVPDDS
jgi:hypothetical protein